MTAPSLFSRILLVVGAVAVIGLTYWFIAVSLAPVPVPPAPPSRGAVRFDPAADITKNATFPSLRPLGPFDVQPKAMGRQNPFEPVPPPPTSTPAELVAPTSTPAEPGATTTTVPAETPTSTAPEVPAEPLP